MKPVITEWDTKLMTAPSRKAAKPIWITPTISESTMAARMNSRSPTSYSPDSDAKTIAEMAVVGPVMACHDEPKNAAKNGGIIAV